MMNEMTIAHKVQVSAPLPSERERERERDLYVNQRVHITFRCVWMGGFGGGQIKYIKIITIYGFL